MKPSDVSTVTTANDPEVRCEVCGRFGASEVAGRVLCEDCYCLAGSCCTEFTPAPKPSQPGDESSAAEEKQSGCM